MTNKQKKKSNYINLVKFDSDGWPNCEEHGAMNCVNKEKNLWRCTQCHIGLDTKDIPFEAE